jgi:hypothetical protein
MTKKAMTDAEFRKEVLADATKALEKLAGKPLPEGSSLKCIEKDPNYQTTLVLPDLLDEEKIDDESLQQVAGGISVALIVSICGGAVGVGPDISGCYAKICPANACAVDATGYGDCSKEACGHKEHEMLSCSANVCAKFFTPKS